MDFNTLIEKCQFYFQSHTAIALALIAAICLFGYLKPNIFFKLLMLALFLGVVLYIVTLIGESATTGLEQKDQMMHKSKELLE